MYKEIDTASDKQACQLTFLSHSEANKSRLRSQVTRKTKFSSLSIPFSEFFFKQNLILKYWRNTSHFKIIKFYNYQNVPWLTTEPFQCQYFFTAEPVVEEKYQLFSGFLKLVLVFLIFIYLLFSTFYVVSTFVLK